MRQFGLDGDVTTTMVACERCGISHVVSTGYVLDRGAAYAIYNTEPHPGSQEVLVDVIMDHSWDSPSPDRVVFACRFGPIEGSAPASSLMKPLRPETEFRGHQLDRDEALAHPWLDDFWEVCDWILFNDPASHPVVHRLIDSGD